MNRDPAILSPEAGNFSHYPGGHAEGFPDAFKQLDLAFYTYIQGGCQGKPNFPTFAEGDREVRICEAIAQSATARNWVTGESKHDRPLRPPGKARRPKIREDLERSVRELGYDPVRNETGAISYGKDSPPEAYAYKELELCDILVSIIGGRYGTESRVEEGSSISQNELKHALERGIQVFIFIEASVKAEFETYFMNKGNESVKYRFVDNVKVYDFIETLYQLPNNNPIATFEVSADITEYLKAQWAGLFQRYLQDKKREAELVVLDEMRA
ncbi:hypothetical protein HK102_013071, partial [Quaeritorhiza haematococci]